MEDHGVIHNLVNFIIKQAFRIIPSLTQLGKLPRFFDLNSGENVANGLLKVLPGFRASAFNYQYVTAVVVDNVNKFLSSDYCIDKIKEIQQDDSIKPADKKRKIAEMFENTSVISMWGHRRAYRVLKVIFDKNPFNFQFINKEGNTTTIAEYFLKTHKIKLTVKDQPLFYTEINDRECYLPPELCVMDGIPSDIRENKTMMRKIMAHCQKTPNQKYNSILEFSQKLFKQQPFKDWGLEINKNPMSIDSKILPLPTIQTSNGYQTCDERILKNIPVQNPLTLEHEKWIFVYEGKNYSLAENVLNSFKKCSKQLDVTVKDPHWIKVTSLRNSDAFETNLNDYIKKKGTP